MNRSIRALLLGAASLSAMAGLLSFSDLSPVRATSQTKQDKPFSSLVPADKLKVRLAKGNDDLLDPTHQAWEMAPVTRVLLSRTPRVYQTEKPAPVRHATLQVQGVAAGKLLIFRLSWPDRTRNAPTAPPKREGEAGDSAKLYKRPTESTASFADAAAIMVPEKFQGGEFPSLVMGDSHGPVRLFYWNASRGAAQLTASGRARVEETGKSFRYQARHDGKQWVVTLELPPLPTPSPIAFAVWEGQVADRNGLKIFSIWYILQ